MANERNDEAPTFVQLLRGRRMSNDETPKKTRFGFRHFPRRDLLRRAATLSPTRLAEARVAVSSFRMRDFEDEPSSRSFAGSLLVAHPSMLDPNFRRTVLFISEHDPVEGALGVIINRPLDRQVADLVTETPPADLAEVPVFLGGPVGKNQLMFAAFEWHQSGGLKLNHKVGSKETSDAIDQTKIITVCAFVGYAGWGAGQLESEMKQKAWLLQKANPSVLKLDRLPNLWFDIMRGLGPWYKMLAAAPDDPSLN
jgi:putative transcriptional regulator